MALLRYKLADFEDPLEAGALSTIGSKALTLRMMVWSSKVDRFRMASRQSGKEMWRSENAVNMSVEQFNERHVLRVIVASFCE